jgi:hypothetical protein
MRIISSSGYKMNFIQAGREIEYKAGTLSLLPQPRYKIYSLAGIHLRHFADKIRNETFRNF